jgi:glycosyltransferase involved in cell wall biosynthesis
MNHVHHAPRVWIIGAGRLHLRIPLMRKLRERGFEPAAVGPEECPQFAGTGFQYARYPFRRSLNLRADRRAISHLRQLFEQHRPDVVHAVNTKPCLLAPEAARQAGVPACVCTITGLGAVFSSRSPQALLLRLVYRRLQRRAAQLSALTVFQNPDDRDYFLRHDLVSPDRQSLVLSSGIDVDAFRARRSDPARLAALRRELKLDGKLVVTMISRPIKPKGIAEYLRAAAAVRQRFPQAVFLLIGSPVTDGPLAFPVERIEQSAADVRHLHNRDDVPDILAVSDLFVLPSYFREGVPRVLLEAGAMGLPLITADSPGCRETVRDGHNGKLVAPRDWRALADAIRELLADAETRREMGRRSPAFIRERFDLTQVADAYAAIYRQALGEATPTRRAA